MRRIVSAIVFVIMLGCTAPALGQEVITVRAGKWFTAKLTNLTATCRSRLSPVRITQQPRYGRVRVYRTTSYQRNHPVYSCNYIVVPAIAVEYRAPSGVTGQDQFSLVFGDRLYSLRVNIVP